MWLPGKVAANTYPSATYWKECAYKAATGNGDQTICNMDSATKISYAGLDLTADAFSNATYKATYPQGNVPPANRIDLLDSQGQLFISYTNKSAWNTVTKVQGPYTTTDNNIQFWVYQCGTTGCSNYSFLASANSDGTMRILTLVDNQVLKDGSVNAWKINKNAVMSTSTGGVCSPGSTDASCTPTPSGQAGGGGVTGTNDACYQSGWELSWLACPVITAAQKAANTIYGFVEGQLKFRVPSDLGGNKCPDGSSKIQCNSVHKTWDEFRILVSALVVILMLVMVISQAIGSGPFDAYTIKKMLPRLVIGVILIQLSWPIFSWVVNTVDDLGVGLADLIYQPFGGAKALDLNTIMGPFTNSVAGGTSVVLFNWVGIGALAVFGVVAPFIVLGMILTVLVAIFVGFLTLLFRKILIILALIFVPVALIAWMMPNDGLRKYWKLWWDNFIKALMMFPLIIALIAGGRIFAKIGSGQGGDFVGFFIVLVGFFGPLFILPKTFKWGGTLMQTVGNGLTKAQERTLKKPKEFLGERQKGYTEERRLKSKERVAAGKGFNPRRPWRYPVDKFLSGQWDPTLTGRRAERALATYKKTGRDAYTEDLAAARIGQQIDWENMLEGDGIVKDDYLQDVYEGKHSIDEKTGKPKEYKTFDGRTLNPLGKKPMERLAALYEMEKLGGATNNRHILKAWESAQEAGPQSQEYSNFRRFMSDSVGTMLPSLTDVYKGTVSTADAGPAGVAKQHGVEVENMLATLTNRIEREQDPTKKAGHIQTLNTYLDSFLSAAENDNLRGGIEQGATRVVKALVTNDSAARDKILGTKPGQVGTIYYDPEDGRVSIGLGRTTDKDGKIVDNTRMATGDDVMAAIRPDLKERLDKIIRTEGGFVDSETIKASAQEGNAARAQTVEVDLRPGERTSPGGVVIAAERRTRPPNFPEPESGSAPPSLSPSSEPTPPSPPPTAGSDTPAGPEGQRGIPPEDFGPEGRFPPPNIPPGPGNV